MKICLSMIVSLILSMPARAEPVRLEVDFAKPDGRWDLPRYALGQGGLQSDPMLAPHVKELRKLRPRTIRLFLSEFSEWNMDLMQPNLSPGFQPAFVLETVRRFAEAGLDMAAYYHVRDCFVDEADFDWMSPGGRNFMAHWWNTMPQYSALFDHHGRVRPAWYAFRLLGQFEGPRFPVTGEWGNIRAIACQREHRRHVLVWRYEAGGPEEVDVRLVLSGLAGGSFRVVSLDAESAVNNLKVLRFQGVQDLVQRPIVLKLRPWEIRWIEIE